MPRHSNNNSGKGSSAQIKALNKRLNKMANEHVGQNLARRGRRAMRNATQNSARGVLQSAVRKHTASSMVDMLLHPCDAQLTQGVFGTNDGLTARLRSDIEVSTTDTCGFVLWCPEFTCGTRTVDGDSVCVLSFSGVDPSLGPVNTPANPLGSGAASTFDSDVSGNTWTDPAFAFASETLVDSTRTISTCMQMAYWGTEDNMSGQWASISGLPTSQLLAGGVTINDLFISARVSPRVGMDTLEVLSRPGQNPEVFKQTTVPDTDDGRGPIRANSKATVNSQSSNRYLTEDPLWYGIAWRNVATAKFSLVLTKNLEWRPANVFGIVQPRLHTTHSRIDAVEESLDKSDPNWDVRTVDANSGSRAVIPSPEMHAGQHRDTTFAIPLYETAKKAKSVFEKALEFFGGPIPGFIYNTYKAGRGMQEVGYRVGQELLRDGFEMIEGAGPLLIAAA